MGSPSKRDSVTSRYLEALGNSTESSPLRSSARFNSSSNLQNYGKEKTPVSPSKDNEENLSPIRRLIKEKEEAVKKNSGQGIQSMLTKSPTKLKLHSNLEMEPAPKLNYQKPNLSRGSRRQEDRENLNRIVSGMSQSPSLKNLSKLKSIESKMKNIQERSNNKGLISKPGSPKRSNTTIDTGRKSFQTHEYLCRIAEAKNWLEKTLKVEIDPNESDEKNVIVDFASYLRNGILLAELSKKFCPDTVGKIYYGTASEVDYKSKSGFQFKYTENINYFFQMLEKINLPTDYRFELTDLYDLKNFPKVIFCLHALAYMLAVQKKCHKLEHLSDDYEFTDQEIKKTENNIRGLKIPNFDNFDDIDNDEEFGTTVDEREVEEVHETPNSHISPSTQQILDEDMFISDGEGVLEYNSLLNDTLDDFYGLSSTVDDIHKKYQSLIEEDRLLSPDKHVSPKEYSSLSPLSIDRGEEIALYLETIINLQALSRGSLLRYQMFVDKFMFKAARENTTELQGLIRGYILRRRLNSLKENLTFHSGGIAKLQSFVKFNKNDEKFFKINGALLFHKDSIIKIQSVLRAHLTRRRVSKLKKDIRLATNEIIKLQSNIRYKSIKLLTSLEIDQIRMITPSVIQLQCLARKKLFKEVTMKSLQKVYTPEEAILMIQSISRGNNVRKLYELLQRTLNRSLDSILEIQTVSRGGICRNRLNKILDTLYEEEQTLCAVAGIGRGFILRNSIVANRRILQKEVNSIIAVQSCFRGVLSRFAQDSLLDELEEEEENISSLQAALRGSRLRKSLDSKKAYYSQPDNLEKVIKIQSFIRTRIQGDAFKLLTTLPKPPLIAVKKFVSLLNDTEGDFDEEIVLAKSKSLIKKTNDDILQLEEELDHLDLKIELLTKNKITIDELVASKHHLNSRSSKPTENQRSNTLPKATREKIEVYDKIFYLLQTQSGYFMRLFELIEKHNFHYDAGLNQNIESFILKIYGYSLHQSNNKSMSREEYLLLKLIMDSIFHSIDKCKSIEEYKSWNRSETSLKGLTYRNSVWELLLTNFYDLVEQRTSLKDLFCHDVENIILDDELDLESHPILIYRSIIEDEERRSERPSQRPVDISAQDLIKDPETREKFVTNLENLREVSNDFILSIENSIDKLPLHVRVLCNELFKYSLNKFPKESERFHLSLVGTLFMKQYFLPILFKPENYGISVMNTFVNQTRSSKIKKNLCEIGKVLYQMVSMRSFSAKNVYLQPLNDFIEQSVEVVRRMLKKLISVKDMDVAYNMSLYDDIVSDQKASLVLSFDDLKSFSKMISNEIDIMAPKRDDLLRNFVSVLKSMPEIGLKTSSHITFELIPVTENENTMTLRTRTLFLQAKRCLLYLIQVQDGDNLVDLLVSHIDSEHEELFKRIVKKEAKELKTRNIQKPYSGGSLNIESYDPHTDKTVVHDLTKMTYHELKKITLEKLLELESLGEITRQDGFQRLLNEIANDIRAKHTHRVSLNRESDKVNTTLQKLQSRKKSLQMQLDNYNREIDQAIKALHSSSTKKKGFWTKLFSRQFYYQRELKRKGRLPQFGSFKYSAKHLYENGILLKVNDMTLIEYELSASGSSKLPKLDFLFSCDKVGIFEIEMRDGINVLGGAHEKLSLDDLLQYQYENVKEIPVFKGVVLFDCNALIAFIFRKFYDKR